MKLMKTTAFNALILLLLESIAFNPLYINHVAYAQEAPATAASSSSSSEAPEYTKAPSKLVRLEQDGKEDIDAVVHGIEKLGRGIEKLAVHTTKDIAEGAVFVYDHGS
jgi:hypothetical protein